MKKTLSIIGFMAIFTVFIGNAIFGADLSTAAYRGQINVINNSYATANNIVPFALNAQSLVDGLYMLPDYSNVAIVDRYGNDIAFMPPQSMGNQWFTWVPNIQQNNTINYYIYTGGANPMGGSLAYFPGSGGMTVNNSSSLQLNTFPFRIELSGYFDSTKAGTYLLRKDQVLAWYYDSVNNLTFSVPVASIDLSPSTLGGLSSTLYGSNYIGQSFGVTTAGYLSTIEITGYDTSSIPTGYTTQMIIYSVNLSNPSSPVLNPTPVAISNNVSGLPMAYDFTVTSPYLIAGTYMAVIRETSNVGNGEVYFESGQNGIANSYVYFSNDNGGTWNNYGYPPSAFNNFKVNLDGSTPILQVPITSGDHTVALISNGAGTISCEIDGTVVASAPWATPFANNTNPWVLLQNGSMPYMYHYRVLVNNILRQNIVWQDSSIFYDSTVYGNNAYPTFPLYASNPSLSANLVNFESLNTSSGGGIPTTTPPGGSPDMPITDIPDDPQIIGIGAQNLANIPFIGKPIASFLDGRDIPYGLFVYPLMIIMIVLAVFAAFAITHDLAWMGAAQFIVAGLFIALKLLIWPTLFFFGIVLVFCIVKRRVIQI